MRILGIDPGLERIGYGIIDKVGSRMIPVAYGLIETPRIEMPQRIRMAHERTIELIDEYKPDCIATERLLFTVNKTTAMDVAKSLGVILLAGAEKGLAWCEYSPPEVKQSVTGVGNADKKQVQFMVTRLLGLAETPKPDDVADGLAVAITHAMRMNIPKVAAPTVEVLQRRTPATNRRLVKV
ncbi:crossover junction endodeoxyribonuclease RuvC [bacterium]|nr:MAG: crossover junction endodeoxyribonuclease RuvC [bacterium]